jgi:hypothetical protein
LGADERPGIGRKDHDGNVAAGEVLLENHILVAGDERVETGLFCFVEQLPV